MPKRTKKSQASAAATRKGRRAARGSALEGSVWRTINARRGYLIEQLEKRILRDWEFDEMKGLNMLADARCVKHKAPNIKLTDCGK